jgi:ABC-2 type transport system ATP-binding protein
MHRADDDSATIDRDGRAAVIAGEQAAPVLSARGLTKRYGSVLAVEGVTFSLEGGTVTGFLGPNGAGKTTTLRLLLGLAQPTTGEALIFGHRYRELAHPAQRVGAVLEDLYLELTTKEAA